MLKKKKYKISLNRKKCWIKIKKLKRISENYKRRIKNKEFKKKTKINDIVKKNKVKKNRWTKLKKLFKRRIQKKKLWEIEKIKINIRTIGTK